LVLRLRDTRLQRIDLQLGVNDERFEELAAGQHQVLRHVVLLLELSLVSAAEGRLEGKDVGNFEFSPEGHPCGGFLGLVHVEAGLLERKKVEEFAHYEGEDPGGVRPVLEVVPVDKQILSTRVPVQIATEHHFSLLVELSYHPLHVPILRVQVLRRCLPAPIQVLSSERAPIVSVDDTVRIEHGNDFEDEVFAQGLRLGCVAHQEIDHALHHPAGVRLARVDSGRNKDAFLGLAFLAVRILLFRSNCDVFAAVACQRAT